MKKHETNVNNNFIALHGTSYLTEVLTQSIVFTKWGQYGLEKDSIVFCNFGQMTKLDQTTFESWSKILIAIPNSELWLWRSAEGVNHNLRRVAMDFGKISQLLDSKQS